MDRQPGEQPRGGRRGAGARVPFGLAPFACLLCVGLAAGSLTLALLNGRSLGEIVIEEGIIAIATLTVAFSVVGALIASHRPRNPIGWVFCAAALFQGLANIGTEYATYALITEPGSVPLGAGMSWLGSWIWAPGLGLILVFLPLLFPDGRLPSRRWLWVGWVGGASIAMISVLALILLWPERGPALLGAPVREEGGPRWTLDVLVETVAFPLMLIAGLAAVVSLFARFRRARGEERQQIKWFAYAAALTLFWIFLVEVLPDSSPLFEAFTAVVGVLVIPSIPIAAGVAIMRYRLYDIDRIINRTLVYGALTVFLALIYFGSVVGLQYVFRTLAGGDSNLVIVASTLTIAALFSPLRRGIQTFIDRRFYRNRYDAAKTLEAFSATLRDETDLGRLGDDLVAVAQETVQPAHASLWLRRSSGGVAGRKPA
ncbi:MAG: hypothetical protein M3533_08715 [Actinomycetota bacterium]|nr:hypothetical protein [Actinomycetota bacterium]